MSLQAVVHFSGNFLRKNLCSLSKIDRVSRKRRRYTARTHLRRLVVLWRAWNLNRLCFSQVPTSEWAPSLPPKWEVEIELNFNATIRDQFLPCRLMPNRVLRRIPVAWYDESLNAFCKPFSGRREIWSHACSSDGRGSSHSPNRVFLDALFPSTHQVIGTWRKARGRYSDERNCQLSLTMLWLRMVPPQQNST